MLAERARFLAGVVACFLTRRHRDLTVVGVGSRMSLCLRCARVTDLREHP